MTRAVVFDLDGTLIDSLPDVTNAANALLADYDLAPLPESQVAGFVGLGERVFLDRLIVATDLEPDRFDPLLDKFIAHYKTSTGATRLFPGVLEAFEVLRQDGFRLGLCTNKPGAPMEAVLTALDLGHWFDAVIAGDTLPLRKPDPKPLHWVLDALGATQGVYVGDSDVDASTAVAAGVPFVFFTEGIRTKPVDDIPHDAAYSDFRELPGLCQTLCRLL